MSNELTAYEYRVYQLSVQQKLDPVRAVVDYRKVEAISDPVKRGRVRRHLTGVTLPVDPDDKDMNAFVAMARAKADRIDATQRMAERIISRWFDSEKNRRWRWLHFLEPADDQIRNIVSEDRASDLVRRAIDAVDHYHAGPDELIAVATTQPGKFWKINDRTTLEVVAEVVSQDVECDLDMFAPTEMGSCMESHERLLTGIAKCDGVDEKGVFGKMRRDYIAERFVTVPFARGNVIVLTRMCAMCLDVFVHSNRINTRTIEFVTPVSDGFGSVGAGPIKLSEYEYNPLRKIDA